MLNHIEIMGNLVAEPEMRTTAAGVKVASFRIACERDYAAPGAQKETDFVDCVAWREKAEFLCGYFSKGKPIVVSGRLQIRKWEDREGNKRSSAEIVAENLYFAGGDKRRSDDGPTRPPSPEVTQVFRDIIDDDEGELPF